MLRIHHCADHPLQKQHHVNIRLKWSKCPPTFRLVYSGWHLLEDHLYRVFIISLRSIPPLPPLLLVHSRPASGLMRSDGTHSELPRLLESRGHRRHASSVQRTASKQSVRNRTGGLGPPAQRTNGTRSKHIACRPQMCPHPEKTNWGIVLVDEGGKTPFDESFGGP